VPEATGTPREGTTLEGAGAVLREGLGEVQGGPTAGWIRRVLGKEKEATAKPPRWVESLRGGFSAMIGGSYSKTKEHLDSRNNPALILVTCEVRHRHREAHK
jgi:hypothetical protein